MIEILVNPCRNHTTTKPWSQKLQNRVLHGPRVKSNAVKPVYFTSEPYLNVIVLLRGNLKTNSADNTVIYLLSPKR